jgi:ubiquinone/menaquinone biosynthesis C-methylase UbiE
MKHADPFETNRSTYDRIAGRFAEINAVMPPELALAGERFLNQIQPGSRFLDLGCGAGRDLAWMEYRGGDGIGADLSGGMLAEASKNHQSPLVQANMVQLCFQDNAFGGVWCAAALLHLPKSRMAEALSEIWRILQPEGVLYLSLKQGEGEGYVTWEQPDSPAYDRFFAHYRQDELSSVLESCRFSVLNSGINPAKNVNWLWFECRKKQSDA